MSSRTLWLVIGHSLASTALLYLDKIDQGIWQTVVIAFFGGWQARRYGDNRLKAQNGGEA